MKKLLLIGIISALICLAALFLYFNYWKPGQKQDSNPPISVIPSTDAPIGYFDLRGQKEVLVDIKGFNFTPQKIVISPGTKMIWRNDDRLFHSVTFDSRPDGITSLVKDSGQMKSGAIFSPVFILPGTYTYHSSDNPQTMTGIILVK